MAHFTELFDISSNIVSNVAIAAKKSTAMKKSASGLDGFGSDEEDLKHVDLEVEDDDEAEEGEICDQDEDFLVVANGSGLEVPADTNCNLSSNRPPNFNSTSQQSPYQQLRLARDEASQSTRLAALNVRKALTLSSQHPSQAAYLAAEGFYAAGLKPAALALGTGLAWMGRAVGKSAVVGVESLSLYGKDAVQERRLLPRRLSGSQAAGEQGASNLAGGEEWDEVSGGPFSGKCVMEIPIIDHEVESLPRSEGLPRLRRSPYESQFLGQRRLEDHRGPASTGWRGERVVWEDEDGYDDDDDDDAEGMFEGLEL